MNETAAIAVGAIHRGTYLSCPRIGPGSIGLNPGVPVHVDEAIREQITRVYRYGADRHRRRRCRD